MHPAHPIMLYLLTFLQVFVGIVEEFEEIRGFGRSESGCSGVIFLGNTCMLVVGRCTLISIFDAPSPKPRFFSEWDILHPTMEQKAGSLSHCFGSYAVSLVSFSAEGGWCGGDGGRRGHGGGDCGGTCESSSVSFSDVSSSLSWESLVGRCPAAAQRACQDGRGHQSSGRSGSGVEG